MQAINIAGEPLHTTKFAAHNIAKVQNDSSSATLPHAVPCIINVNCFLCTSTPSYSNILLAHSRCLADNGWDYQKSAERFTSLNVRKKHIYTFLIPFFFFFLEILVKKIRNNQTGISSSFKDLIKIP